MRQTAPGGSPKTEHSMAALPRPSLTAEDCGLRKAGTLRGRMRQVGEAQQPRSPVRMRALPLHKRGWLTEGIVLAAIPVMAYVLAFGFEYGYYIAYGFPQELISVDLNRVFVAGVIFLAGVLFVVALATVALALLPSDHPLAPAVAQAQIGR